MVAGSHAATYRDDSAPSLLAQPRSSWSGLPRPTCERAQRAIAYRVTHCSSTWWETTRGGHDSTTSCRRVRRTATIGLSDQHKPATLLEAMDSVDNSFCMQSVS